MSEATWGSPFPPPDLLRARLEFPVKTAWLAAMLVGSACVTPGHHLVDDKEDAWDWSLEVPEPWSPPPLVAGQVDPAPSDFVGHLVATRAVQLVGRSIRQEAPQLPDDCSGLVRAAWKSVNVELTAKFERGDNAVTAIWRFATARNALEPWDAASPSVPRFAPGDILFFRDTYDRNRDGRFNDGLTHVAIVEEVLSDGTVVYIHRGGTGVARGHLNLSQPSVHTANNTVLNDYLRPQSRLSKPVLGCELFAGLASARLLVPSQDEQRSAQTTAAPPK